MKLRTQIAALIPGAVWKWIPGRIRARFAGYVDRDPQACWASVATAVVTGWGADGGSLGVDVYGCHKGAKRCYCGKFPGTANALGPGCQEFPA